MARKEEEDLDSLSFAEFKSILKERLILLEEYELNFIPKSEFVDSYELLNKNRSQKLKRAMSPSPRQSKQFFPDLIEKREDGKIWLKCENLEFSTRIEFFNYALARWDFETVIDAFTWQEFESSIREILEELEFTAFRTFRFKHKKKRYEVDVVASQFSKIFFIDGKHWKANNPSPAQLRTMAQSQKERVEACLQSPTACGELLSGLKFDVTKESLKQARVYPIIVVSHSSNDIRWIESVPICPIHAFNSFLLNFACFQPMFYAGKINRVERQTLLEDYF